MNKCNQKKLENSSCCVEPLWISIDPGLLNVCNLKQLFWMLRNILALIVQTFQEEVAMNPFRFEIRNRMSSTHGLWLTLFSDRQNFPNFNLPIVKW
jgi:hypothetical protein